MTNKTIQKIMALPLSQRIEFLTFAVTNNVAEPFEQKVIVELLSDNITSWVITHAVTEYKRVIDVVVQHAGTSKDLTVIKLCYNYHQVIFAIKNGKKLEV